MSAETLGPAPGHAQAVYTGPSTGSDHAATVFDLRVRGVRTEGFVEALTASRARTPDAPVDSAPVGDRRVRPALVSGRAVIAEPGTAVLVRRHGTDDDWTEIGSLAVAVTPERVTSDAMTFARLLRARVSVTAHIDPDRIDRFIVAIVTEDARANARAQVAALAARLGLPEED